MGLSLHIQDGAPKKCLISSLTMVYGAYIYITIDYVGSWLVPRVAIVAIFPNYSETHVLFGGFTFVAKHNWESLFFEQKIVIAERHVFFLKNAVAQSR